MLSLFNKQTTIPTPPYSTDYCPRLRNEQHSMHSFQGQSTRLALTSAQSGTHCSLIWGCNCACVRGCIRPCVCVCVCLLECVGAAFYMSLWFIFLRICCWVYNSRVHHFVHCAVLSIRHVEQARKMLQVYACMDVNVYLDVQGV